jgi:D-alanine-D-alanine ligase-like ATP-grasp enzyme
MQRRYPYPTSTRILLQVASGSRIRARVLDPATGYLIELVRGQRRHLAYQHILPLNLLAATYIATDKSHTRALLARSGYRVPEGQIFFRQRFFRKVDYARGRGLTAALGYARRLGYPVYVKPNSLSQGLAVRRVYSPAELRAAVRAIFELVTEREYAFVIERPVDGLELRLLVLDGKLLAAIRREPPGVVGDGRRPLRALIARFQKQARARGLIPPDSAPLRRCLRAQGLTLGSVLPRGAGAVLDDTATNLSRGGRAQIVPLSQLAACGAAQLARRVAELLDLRYAAIDLKIPSLSAPMSDATILEVNSAPGLSRLYELGYQREVFSIYRRLLAALFKAHR